MEVYSLQGTIVAGQEAVGMRYFGENCVAVGKTFFTIRTVNHEKFACWSDGVTFEDMACQGPGSSPLRPCVLQKMGPVSSRGPWQCGHVLQGCAPVCRQMQSGGLNHKCIISSLTSRVLSLPFFPSSRSQSSANRWSWYSCRKKCCYPFILISPVPEFEWFHCELDGETQLN